MTASTSHPVRQPPAAIASATASGRMVSPIPMEVVSSDIARARRRTNHFAATDDVPRSKGVEKIMRETPNAT